jgi:Caspase domain
MKRLLAPYLLVSLLIVAVYLLVPHGSCGDVRVKEFSPRRDWVVAPPHIYVLAVGIDHYPRKVFMDLAGSVNDAEMLAAVFKSPRFSPQAEVQILTEQRATKNAIRSAIQRWAGLANPEDLFVLSFSGQQGTRTQKDLSGEVYMAPYDATRRPNCNEGFSCADQESLISGALLYSWMTQIRSRRQVLLLDTGLTERAIPVFERYWRKEACNVGP